MTRLRLFVAAVAAFALTPLAGAHFAFVVPGPDGSAISVVFSDDLEPDENVPIARIAGLKLFARGADGQVSPVEHQAEGHALKATVSGAGPKVIYGTLDYGVLQKGDAPAYRLAYFPKALVGRVPADRAAVGESVPAELVPESRDGETRLRLIANGKPVEGAEVTVFKPDGAKAKLTTGKDGRTDRLDAPGRYGAWAKVVDPTPGEHDGKKYAETRHYATLVFDLESGPAETDGAVNSPYPPLPVGVSSLGAVSCDGYLYVYGGHAGRTHSYDTQSVVGTFHRLKLGGGTAWEELPGGPILQGMNLATVGGKIYRVGGMQPRNVPGEPADNHSLAEVAVFDPQAGRWEPVSPLPAGRSSHDVVAVGDKLVVVGGWESQGRGQESRWHDTTLILDLSAERPEWKSLPQPFKKRALTAAAVGNKVYVLGGLADGGTDKTTHILDVANETWSVGPDLPGSDRSAFSPAATVVNGRLIVNTSAGPVFRLTADGTEWERVGEAARKRMVARMVPLNDRSALLVGGATGRGNVAEVEVIELAQ